jgi:GDP-fucose transporter C1
MQKAPERTNYAKIATVVSAYFVISISLVFLNKTLLTKGTSIPAPLFVTWFQCVVTAVIIWALGALGQSQPPDSSLREFPTQIYETKIALKVAPLSLCFIGMVTFNNLCLQFVEVSFYNVARSLTIVMNVIFTYVFLGVGTSVSTLGCLGVVIFGFFVGADGEVNFSLIGTVFGVTSSAFVSLNSIYTKSTLPKVGGDKWVLAYYNNVNATLGFIPLMFMFGEHNTILEYWDLLYSSRFWLIMWVAGVFGFAIGIVTVMQINVTSPLTHNISGTAKACVQTLLALWWYGNETTAKAMFGVFLVIFGSFAYAYVKVLEDRASEAAKQANKASGPANLTGGGGNSGAISAEKGVYRPVPPQDVELASKNQQPAEEEV